jgi:hypothetical protein
MIAFKRLAPAIVGFAVLTVVMTWPLAWRAGSVLPDSDDAYFSVWRLAWVAHQLPAHPAQLFDANIFYPSRGTLTYSDAMLLLGAAGAPAIWAGVHPVLVHNVLLLSAFILSGVGTFLLTRDLTGATAPAVLAGIVFAFGPYRVGHIAHLELQWAGWMPLALWALHRLVESGKLRFGALVGLFVGFQGLCSLYYVAFFLVCLPVLGGTLVGLRRPASWTGLVKGLCLATLLGGAILGPYALVYRSARGDLTMRTTEEVVRYSATPASYASVAQDNRLYAGVLETASLEELSLFPGAVAAGLALLALWPPVSRTAIVYLTGLGFSFLASLGPAGGLFSLLQSVVPVLASVRAPARFGVLVLLSLAVLTAVGSARLLVPLSRKASLAVAGVLMFACLGEYWSVPVRIRKPILEAPLVHRWLATQPRGTVVLALPYPDPSRLWGLETTHQYLSIYHWQPLVNGYSGFGPSQYLRTLEILRTFPDAESIRRLRALSVSYVLIDRNDDDRPAYDAIVSAIRARSEFEAPMFFPDPILDATLFRLRP